MRKQTRKVSYKRRRRASRTKRSRGDRPEPRTGPPKASWGCLIQRVPGISPDRAYDSDVVAIEHLHPLLQRLGCHDRIPAERPKDSNRLRRACGVTPGRDESPGDSLECVVHNVTKEGRRMHKTGIPIAIPEIRMTR